MFAGGILTYGEHKVQFTGEPREVDIVRVREEGSTHAMLGNGNKSALFL